VVVFFDTSVLVASSNASHPHFAQASAVVGRVASGKDKGIVSQHSIAELYSALTLMPVIPRIHPLEAARLIRDNILKNFDTVALHKDDYLEALKMVSESGWPGGKIYDALLLCCADRSGAQRIYTFNLKDFKLLAPERVQHMICAP
jgi:predicted nucleic acid-binding protein